MARVMPRAFLFLSTTVCLGWLTLISKVQHGPWRGTGTIAQRATGAASLSLIVSERGSVRHVESSDLWAKWFGHGELRMPSPRFRLRDSASQSETAQGEEDRIRRADEAARPVPHTP
jgi:hypothetical protein